MLAISTWGLVLIWGWIGGLVLALVGQAGWMWFKFQLAERSAIHARRLSEATRPPAERPASILTFKPRGHPTPMSPSGKAQP
jgi:hypothetical protein